MKINYKGKEIEVWKISHDDFQPDWVKKEFTQLGGFKWQDKTHLRVGYGMVYGAVVASVGEFVVKGSHEIISSKKLQG